MNAPADGYTLLFHSVAIAVNPSLFSQRGLRPCDRPAAGGDGRLHAQPALRAPRRQGHHAWPNCWRWRAPARWPTPRRATAPPRSWAPNGCSAAGQGRHHARAVPAGRGHQRGGQRPGADRVHVDAACRAFAKSGQGAPDGGDVAQAQPGAARRAHRGRTGLQGLRGQHLVRAVRPGQNAERRAGPVERRDQQGAGREVGAGPVRDRCRSKPAAWTGPRCAAMSTAKSAKWGKLVKELGITVQ
jgi:hypothetical protein